MLQIHKFTIRDKIIALTHIIVSIHTILTQLYLSNVNSHYWVLHQNHKQCSLSSEPFFFHLSDVEDEAQLFHTVTVVCDAMIHDSNQSSVMLRFTI